MGMPTGLFVDTPELNDASLTAVSQNAEEWPEELIQKLKERVPSCEGMSLLVKIMKKDEENGAATGSIVVTSSTKTAIVPIIIKDFQLYPIDVFIVNKKLLPLTPDYFKSAFQDNASFQKLEEYPTYGGLGRFEDSNLWHATYPPSLGRYAYASAGYDILDSISDTIDGESLKTALLADASTAARFSKSEHADVIKKVANLKAVNMNEFRQGAEKLIPRNILMVKKEGYNKYNVLSNSDSVFSPSLHQCGRDELTKLVTKIVACPQDLINDVDQNGEKMLDVPGNVSQDSGPYMEQGIAAKPQQANEFGNYVVKKKNGVEVEGIVIPKVINFNMELVPIKVFLGKTMSTIQTEISGVRQKNSEFCPRPQAVKTGQTGVFVHHHGPAKALCTIPVTISSMTEDCGSTTMKAVDLQGVTYKLRISNMDGLQRIAFTGDEFQLPKSFKWFPMEGFDEITSNSLDYAAKTASESKTSTPVTLMSTGYDQFAIRGVDKYAYAASYNPGNLESYQAKFLLSSMGMKSNAIEGAMKTAKASGQAVIHGLKRLPLMSEKIATAVPAARAMAKIASDLKCDLIKSASYVENSQTVDALLSLNFVTPENVSKFVNKLPSFKAAISNLASCLIASRLGIREIPEQSVSTAMVRMIEVVNGLEALRATQEG